MKTLALIAGLLAINLALAAEPKLPPAKELSPGWGMMSPGERDEHRQKMMGFKTYDECKAYIDEHHKQMDERAKEQGRPMPMMRRNPCDRMKARGFFK